MEMELKYKRGMPYPLGASLTHEGLQFCHEVGWKGTTRLCLYDGKSTKPFQTIELSKQLCHGRVASVVLTEGHEKVKEYAYEMNGVTCSDPHGRVTLGVGKLGSNVDFAGTRSGFLPEFDWLEDERPLLDPSQVILYRLNVRGFTKHSSSKAAAKGTFRGIIEKIPYLKKLGVNQIELMPVYEFIDTVVGRDHYEVPQKEPAYKCNVWGYARDARYYSVKRAYAAGKDPSLELKELVKALHENGMELILEFYFPEGTKMPFLLDCLRFWATEYHVDGFHVTGWVPDLQLIEKEPLFSDRKIYSGWFPTDGAHEKRELGTPGRCIGIYSDQYLQTIRCFLKSDVGVSREAAWLMAREEENHSCINYVTAHDGFTLCDLVSYEQKHNEANEEDNLDGADYNFSWNCGCEGRTRKPKILELRKRQMRNAWVMLLFSRGIPALLAGDECCNSQGGNNNTYCQDNATGWVNWNAPKPYSDMTEFVRRLISLRRTYQAIWRPENRVGVEGHRDNYPLVSHHGSNAWHMEFHPGERHFGVMYYSADEKDEDGVECLYVAYNMNWTPQRFALPRAPEKLRWHVLVDTWQPEMREDREQEEMRYIDVRERSCIVLGTKLPAQES